MVRQSAKWTSYGNGAVKFFTCDQHILSCVTQRSSFRQSEDDFAAISDDDAKSYRVEIIEAIFYVRKMTLNNGVVSAIEKLY